MSNVTFFILYSIKDSLQSWPLVDVSRGRGDAAIERTIFVRTGPFIYSTAIFYYRPLKMLLSSDLFEWVNRRAGCQAVGNRGAVKALTMNLD